MGIQPDALLKTENSRPRKSNLVSLVRRSALVVVRYEVWVLAPLVAATMLSARLLPVSVGAALLFWLLRWIGTGRLTSRTPADIPIGFLLLVLPITGMVTVFPEKTTPQVLRLLSGIALFYAIINWAITRRRLRLLSMGIIGVGFVLVLMSPVSVTWVAGNKLSFLPVSLYERFSVLVSDSVHPNVMGGNLVLFFPFSMGLLVFSWKELSRIERSLLLVAALSMAGVIILTKSRGGWLSLAAVCGLIILLRLPVKWFLLSLIPIGIFTYFGFSAPAIEAIFVSDALGGFQGRAEIASRAIYMIQDFPFTGIGMGSFENIADLLYPFFRFPPGHVVHAHNLFLQIAVDLGIPGFITWMSVFLLTILCSMKIFQSGIQINNAVYAGLGAGLLGSHLALTIHGLTDAVTWGMVRPAPLVWVIWGLAVSLVNYQKKQS